MQNQISEHGMFPFVYVQVRQWAAWKVHLCNSIAEIRILPCPFSPVWNMLTQILWL